MAFREDPIDESRVVKESYATAFRKLYPREGYGGVLRKRASRVRNASEKRSRIHGVLGQCPRLTVRGAEEGALGDPSGLNIGREELLQVMPHRPRDQPESAFNNFCPSGLPSPVQASQPGPAE
jgi:hypothetical protein